MQVLLSCPSAADAAERGVVMRRRRQLMAGVTDNERTF